MSFWASSLGMKGMFASSPGLTTVPRSGRAGSRTMMRTPAAGGCVVTTSRAGSPLQLPGDDILGRDRLVRAHLDALHEATAGGAPELNLVRAIQATVRASMVGVVGELSLAVEVHVHVLRGRPQRERAHQRRRRGPFAAAGVAAGHARRFPGPSPTRRSEAGQKTRGTRAAGPGVSGKSRSPDRWRRGPWRGAAATRPWDAARRRVHPVPAAHPSDPPRWLRRWRPRNLARAVRPGPGLLGRNRPLLGRGGRPRRMIAWRRGRGHPPQHGHRDAQAQGGSASDGCHAPAPPASLEPSQRRRDVGVVRGIRQHPIPALHGPRRIARRQLPLGRRHQRRSHPVRQGVLVRLRDLEKNAFSSPRGAPRPASASCSRRSASSVTMSR